MQWKTWTILTKFSVKLHHCGPLAGRKWFIVDQIWVYLGKISFCEEEWRLNSIKSFISIPNRETSSPKLGNIQPSSNGGPRFRVDWRVLTHSNRPPTSVRPVSQCQSHHPQFSLLTTALPTHLNSWILVWGRISQLRKVKMVWRICCFIPVDS